MTLTNEQIEIGFNGLVRSLLEDTEGCRAISTTIASGLGEHYEMVRNSSIDPVKREEYFHLYGKTLAEARRNLTKCGMK